MHNRIGRRVCIQSILFLKEPSDRAKAIEQAIAAVDAAERG
jgi:hypothetical protein